MREDHLSLIIRTDRVFRVLLLVIVLLILANVAVLGAFMLGWVESTAKKIFDLFYVRREGNVPTWFSTFLLAACSVALGLVAKGKSVRDDRFALHWWTLCGIFLLLSLDESAQIHESFNRWMGVYLNWGGLFYYPWVILGSLFTLVLGIIYTRFLLALDRRTRLRFLKAGAVYLAGALGMEAIGGWVEETRGTENWVYFAEATLEESLEMLGAAMFLAAVLDHLRFVTGSLRITLKEDA